jgi:hypothetical protein
VGIVPSENSIASLRKMDYNHSPKSIVRKTTG